MSQTLFAGAERIVVACLKDGVAEALTPEIAQNRHVDSLAILHSLISCYVISGGNNLNIRNDLYFFG